MPQWDYPYTAPYSIYQCERPYAEAPQLIECKLRQPLKSLNHIRLLKVYPPGWPDRLTENVTHEEDPEIQCDVYQVALVDVTTKKRPYFATLSYVWGNINVTREIRCGKERSSITLSLHEALVYIRNRRTPRLLWVDSLCINQNDGEEKGHQVQRMHLIYGQSHCISWLGIELGGADDLTSMLPVLRWFSKIAQTLAKHTQGTSYIWDVVDDYIHNSPAHGISSLRQVPWARLYQCLDRVIFERLWCVQEILVARSNDIRSSKSHIDIAVLARSTDIISKLLSELRKDIRDLDHTLEKTEHTWGDIRRVYLLYHGIARMLITQPLPRLEYKKKVSIRHTTAWSVVIRNCEKECSDPRDHVHGLAALCNSGTSYRITYSKAPLAARDVFVDFTLRCIRTTKSLEAFRNGFRSTAICTPSLLKLNQPHRSWMPGLPSWCSDFAGPMPDIRELSDFDHHRAFRLKACKGRPARLTLLSRQQIGVIGIEIGTIQACSKVQRGKLHTERVSEYSSYQWASVASIRRCISSAAVFVPAKSLWKLYLDVRSTGADWRCSFIWPRVAHMFPSKTRDRMVKSSIGAAWIMSHLPEFASEAGLSPNRNLSPRDWRAVAEDTDAWVSRINHGARIFSTGNARAILGTGPEGLCVGDVVCVLFGSDVPFILRPSPEGDYQLIGECYVSGIMRGEALDMGLEEREFLIV
jgi:hypothetical protein